MKLKMKIMILMGSLLLLVFALNLGVASANPPDAQGVGDFGDTANDATGENVNLEPGPFGGGLSDNGHNTTGVDIQAVHNPTCAGHDGPKGDHA